MQKHKMIYTNDEYEFAKCIGNAISKIRISKHMTQCEIAQACDNVNIYPALISRIETGNYVRVPLIVLLHIANAMDTSLFELLSEILTQQETYIKTKEVMDKDNQKLTKEPPIIEQNNDQNNEYKQMLQQVIDMNNELFNKLAKFALTN
jgi:transcriptional regulator with XRE-family HTH domain